MNNPFFRRGLTLTVACLAAAVLVVAGFSLAQAGREDRQQLQKLVISFQKQKDPAAIREQAREVASFLQDELGMPVEVQVPQDYAATVQALVSRTADVAYVDSLPFLLARRDGNARLLLAEVRTDAQGQERTDYDSILVVRADSDIRSIEDVKARAAELRICFTSPTSTSGYVFAYKRFVDEGILQPRQDPRDVFAGVSYGGSYTQALQEVASGRADVCAVSFYTLEGPRADAYTTEELRDQLRILARTPGVPTHVICVRDGIDQEMRDRIKAALLKLSEERSDLLADVYGAKTLTEVDEDEHVKGTVQALDYLGVGADRFVGQK